MKTCSTDIFHQSRLLEAQAILDRMGQIGVGAKLSRDRRYIDLYPRELVPVGITVAAYEWAEEIREILLNRTQ